MDSGSIQSGCMHASYCEDESEKKVVYLFIINQCTGGLFKVVTFNPHQEEEDPSHKGFVDVTSMFMDKMPPELEETRFPTIQVSGPQVYFIGGNDGHPVFPRDSKKVFAFNTSSKAWAHRTPTRYRRFLSTVATYQGHIYVFGSANWWREPDRESDGWAEVYDPQTDQWNCLPGGVPPEALRERGSCALPVVSNRLKIVFLCLRNIDVYAYSLDTKCWIGCVREEAFTDIGLLWNDAGAVLDNTLFWECYATIQSIDLDRLADPPVPKYTLPDSMMRFGTLTVDVTIHQPTYLCNVGNGKLLLCYACWDEPILRCHTFEVTRSPTEKQLHLQAKHAQDYAGGPHWYLLTAQVACSLCNETMERDILAVHKGESCPQRIATCEYCEFPLPAVDLSEHQVHGGSDITAGPSRDVSAQERREQGAERRRQNGVSQKYLPLTIAVSWAAVVLGSIFLLIKTDSNQLQ